MCVAEQLSPEAELIIPLCVATRNLVKAAH